MIGSLVMTVVCLGVLPASSAFAGNLFATGHDLDFHCAAVGDQCVYVDKAVTFVRSGAPDPTKPVLVLDKNALAFPRALTATFGAGAVPIVVMDPSSPAFATAPINTTLYSAILIASDTTCDGCDLNTAGATPDSDAINARKADIAAFFNAGGGLLYASGALHGDGNPGAVYYNSAPLPLGGLPVAPPFTLTPAGIAFGLTNAAANCCATHNSFSDPGAASAFKVLERDSAGNVETLIGSGGIVGGNIFSLTLSPASATNPVGKPHTVTATLTDRSGPVSAKPVLFTVTGVNPTTGRGTTNASGKATFTYTGTAAGTDTIKACADLNANGICDSTGGEPSATATKTWVASTPKADLSLTKSASPTPTVLHGQNVTYTLTQANAGPNTAVAPTITDTLPANQSFVSGSPGCSAVGRVVTCTTADLPSASSASVTIVARADAVGNGQTDSATVSSKTSDPNAANNTATATVNVVPAADLSLTKSSSPNPVIAGQQLTYKLTATNAGPDTAVNAKVIDTLPAGATFLNEGTPPAGSPPCTAVGRVVTCQLGDIPAGGTATATIVVSAAQPPPSSVTNSATVSSGTADPNPANNTATNTTTVSPSCTRTITGSHTGAIVVPSGTFLCLVDATQTGAILVEAGGALTVTNSTVRGGIRSDGAVFMTLCGSTVESAGAVIIKNTRLLVRVGDDVSHCAGNHLTGSLTLTGNTGGVEVFANTIDGSVAVDANRGASAFSDAIPEVEGNTIGGALACSTNNPAPINEGLTNTTAGAKLGQCTRL